MDSPKVQNGKKIPDNINSSPLMKWLTPLKKNREEIKTTENAIASKVLKESDSRHETNNSSYIANSVIQLNEMNKLKVLDGIDKSANGENVNKKEIVFDQIENMNSSSKNSETHNNVTKCLSKIQSAPVENSKKSSSSEKKSIKKSSSEKENRRSKSDKHKEKPIKEKHVSRSKYYSDSKSGSDELEVKKSRKRDWSKSLKHGNEKITSWLIPSPKSRSTEHKQGSKKIINKSRSASKSKDKQIVDDMDGKKLDKPRQHKRDKQKEENLSIAKSVEKKRNQFAEEERKKAKKIEEAVDEKDDIKKERKSKRKKMCIDDFIIDKEEKLKEKESKLNNNDKSMKCKREIDVEIKNTASRVGNKKTKDGQCEKKISSDKTKVKKNQNLNSKKNEKDIKSNENTPGSEMKKNISAKKRERSSDKIENGRKKVKTLDKKRGSVRSTMDYYLNNSARKDSVEQRKSRYSFTKYGVEIPSFSEIKRLKEQLASYTDKVNRAVDFVENNKELRRFKEQPEDQQPLECTTLTNTELEEYFYKFQPHLTEIIKGKEYNWRHEEFVKSLSTYKKNAGLSYSPSMGVFTSSQKDLLAELCGTVFDKSPIEKKDKYYFEVLLPEVCLSIFMEVHGMNRKDAVSYLEKRPMEDVI